MTSHIPTQGGPTGHSTVSSGNNLIDLTSTTEDGRAVSYTQRLENKIWKSSAHLESLLTPAIDDTLNKNDILNLHKSSLPVITADMNKLDELLDNYHKVAGVNASGAAIKKGEHAINTACDWREALMLKYSILDCGNKSLDPKFFSDLAKFSEQSDISIYEHLSKFDQLVADNGSKKERATLLYSKYISEDIQRKCYELREDYEKLRNFLLRRYGDPRTMCINIIKAISDCPPNDSTFSKALMDHFRILEAAFKKINELFNLPTVSQEQLDSYVYS